MVNLISTHNIYMAEELRQPCEEVARIILWHLGQVGDIQIYFVFYTHILLLLTNFVLAP